MPRLLRTIYKTCHRRRIDIALGVQMKEHLLATTKTFVSYACETWSPTIRGQQGFRVLKNRVPRRVIRRKRGGGDRAMAQAVSRRPLTAEAWVRAWLIPCGMCGAQSVTGTGFFSEFFGFPLSSFYRGSPVSYIVWGLRDLASPIDMITKKKRDAVTRGWIKSYNSERHSLYASPGINLR
jgi:hypothetical protein